MFYEVGIAHTVGKNVVLITRSERDIPSDIKHFDYIPYAYTPEGVDALVKKLEEFLGRHFDKRFQEASRLEGKVSSTSDI